MIALIKKYPALIGFGIFQIAFSAPGQTFLIALFVPSLYTSLGISISQFAGIYSVATICAALLLTPMGPLLDKWPLPRIIGINTLAMAVGCGLLASATNTLMLFAAFLILRHFGQGIFLLTTSTAFTKCFQKNRGKALAISTLGFSLSEAIYPSLALLLLSTLEWRNTYWFFGAITIAFMYPLLRYLLSNAQINTPHILPDEATPNTPSTTTKAIHQYRLKDALRDPAFYLILIASSIPPVVMTGILFHQKAIFDWHNWPIHWAAIGLATYAGTKAIGALVIGPIIDKKGPLYPFISLILMLGAGTIFMGIGGATWTVAIYFGLIGVALGISAPVKNVIWANLYGTQHIGSIKGFIATFRNGFTALGPLPIALAIDHGTSLSKVLIITGIAILILAIIPYAVSLKAPRINLTH
ncbi:MFS transporter [bacterium]|jgi:MFS family permease|nr:MFS transporter [bacterium]